jgi:uncharacterized protein YbbK (DUF523 family)/uncharacterized protein YbgA (DUF1722 family)
MLTEGPVVVVSACLEFKRCRFNGSSIRSEVVRRLKPFVDFIPVCPELAIGLGVPRRRCRLIQDPRGPGFVQLGGRDLSAEISGFSRQFLDMLPPVNGFLLKSASPSCALRDARIYPEEAAEQASAKTAGVFGGHVKQRFPFVPAEDDGRLCNHQLRDAFLTALFASARLRRALYCRRPENWRRFHEQNHLLIRVHDQAALRHLDALIDTGRAAEYGRRVQAALSRRPRTEDHRAVIVYAVRDLLQLLPAAEKAFFQDLLNDYSDHKVPLSVPRTLVREWAVRFERFDLVNQSYFTPYPEELLFLTDSGQGRDI